LKNQRASSMLPAVYRPRPVIIRLYYPVLDSDRLKKAAEPIKVDLFEVTAVRESTVADVAVFTGVAGSVIQPWYFKPMEVDIEGKSYIGAFDPGIFSTNVGKDPDIEKILTLRDKVTEIFSKPSAAPKEMFYAELEYGQQDNELKRGVYQSLRGHIADITINEEEGTPYVKTYTIKFVGELLEVLNITSGAGGNKDDVATQAGEKTRSEGSTVAGKK